MPASLTLSIPGREAQDGISLGEVLARDGLGEGDPLRVVGDNDGTVALREVVVGVSEDGANYVQLAIDSDGEPGVWAAPGESIAITEETLFPGEQFSFWAKAVYEDANLEGHKRFDFIINAVSIG